MKKFISLLAVVVMSAGFAQVTITQNEDTETVNSDPYSTCNKNDPENPSFTYTVYTKLSRSFNLESFGITSDFTVTGVAFGAGFSQFDGPREFTLKLATTDAPYPNGSLTELYSGQVFIFGEEQGTLKDFELTAPVVVPAGSELVMSFEKDQDPARTSWAAATNEAGHTAPAYITAPDCNISTPTVLRLPFGGNPEIQVLMTITGTAGNLGTVELNSKSLSVYPNPAKDVINVSLKQGSLQSIEIVNLSGQSVYAAKSVSSVNVAFLPAGVYIIRVKDSNGTTHMNKFIKK